MSSKINQKAIAKNHSGEDKCFFCECTTQLKAFRSFFICESCVNAATDIAEDKGE